MSAACLSSGQGAEPAASRRGFWLLGAELRALAGVRSFSPLQCCHLPSKPCWRSMTQVLPEGKTAQGSRNKFLFSPSGTTLLEHRGLWSDFSSPTGSSQMLPHLTAGYGWWGAKNRGLLLLWWIEFDAGIMATNGTGNVAFHFCGFSGHRDDHLLLADWNPQLRSSQKHFSPGYFLSHLLSWYL